MQFYVGIDLGGTFIKGGLVSYRGEILKFERVPTRVQDGSAAILSDLDKMIETLVKGLKGKLMGIGIGIPGLVDSKRENVVIAPNLGWKNVEVADALKEKYACPVVLANDANAAGLGEAKFGSGAKYDSSVFLTLGTGVGSAIILNGKLFEGNCSAGGEVGHMIIRAGGNQCACGRCGCYETYASATALIRETKKAMLENRTSKMWEIKSVDNVCGKTPFDYYNTDETAKKVVDEYVENLTIGILNVANILRPQAILLGGGIAKQGKFLTEKVDRLLKQWIYAGELGPEVKILTATLDEAGVIGAASLNM